MAGYIGSKASVTQVDGYNRTEADAEFLNQTEGDARYLLNTAETGKILQVVQVVFDGTFSTTVTNGTFAQVTGLNASITPSSASSKILVTAHVNASSYYWEVQSRLTRDGTAIDGALGATRGVRTRVTTSTMGYAGSISGYGDKNFDFTYLDSPATTSSVTYGVQVSGYAGYTVGINYNAYSDVNSADYFGTPISTITLMEIAG